MARNPVTEIIEKEGGASAGFPTGLGLLEIGLLTSMAET